MITEFQGPYRFLSNFYPVSVSFGGDLYPTVEHAYQAAKTSGRYWQAEIRDAATPREAKRLGRRAPLRSDWEDVKVAVMLDLLRQKFCVEAPVTKQLLETGDQELVEGNTWGDTFWGVCEGERGKSPRKATDAD